LNVLRSGQGPTALHREKARKGMGKEGKGKRKGIMKLEENTLDIKENGLRRKPKP